MLYPIQNDVRNRLDLSGIWDFQTDPDGSGEPNGWFNGLAAARPIAVPGSWNEQYEDIFNYLGLAWYVKRAYIPQGWQGQRIYLRVGSANYLGTVYVNGVKVGSHEGGHLPFAFEITELVKWDAENVIAISVENELQPTRVPSGNISSPLGGSLFRTFPRTTFDFFPFAGLHRPVVLYSLPQTHIEDVTVVTGIGGNGSSGAVAVTVQLNAPVSGQGAVTLTGGDQSFSTQLSFAEGKAAATITVPNAHLWSNTDPYLYTLTITTETDRYTLQTGIRTIEVRGHEILLNGQPVQLNGFGRHEDFYASGKGLNYPLLVKDYQLMRWTGATSYRTSHYPYSEEEMQLADREGFLIIDEIPAVSLQFENEENAAARLAVCLQQIDELIARDKNHPSVIMWSLANEPHSKRPPARAFFRELYDLAKGLDVSRPATLVNLQGVFDDSFEFFDVVCLNRYYGWYATSARLEEGFAELSAELDALHAQFPKPFILAEFGADTLPGWHAQPPEMFSEEYQAEFLAGYIRVLNSKPYVVGQHVWNMCDFKTGQGVHRPASMNLKGVFTRDRRPKLAAHRLRELWTGQR